MDFSFFLLLALLITGAVLVWDRVFRKPQVTKTSRSEKIAGSESHNQVGLKSSRSTVIIDYARAFFPVILIVFVLRSFVIEPFRIPSGSMLPTLHIGDFILVDKFRYGIRFPVFNLKVIPVSSPERGEVMVFRYPHDNRTNFIKRVVGLPGDEIVYVDKRIFINGVAVEDSEVDRYTLITQNRSLDVIEHKEVIGESTHRILNDVGRQSRSMKITVPIGSYFVMGDNRDHSNDSRYWGFVPERNVVGRAFLVWFSWDKNQKLSQRVNWARIGDRIP
ncbi:MAG: signal peptidase I [Acidiferrobacteraceae bacterium]|nr:signal peptidase I [Acidiferrobacteraceae bacterium]